MATREATDVPAAPEPERNAPVGARLRAGAQGLALGLTLLLSAGCSRPAPPPDLLLVVIDTLRADGLSSYGNPRPTSPVLDALAAESVLFERALAPSPSTAPSHATLFTGLGPWAHRVANLTSLEFGTPGLDDGFETLAEHLKDAGYTTAAITDGGPLGRGWNLMQGFDHLEAAFEGVEAKVDQALAWLDAQPANGPPRLLFLHTYQVHQPFAPPDEWIARFDADYEGLLREALAEVRAARERGQNHPDGLILLRRRAEFGPRDVEYLRALYDAEIAFTDHHLGRLFDRLRAGPRFAPMGIAVTSDHGEEFGEHGAFGHTQVYDETLHIPLLLRLPEARLGGLRVPSRVALADLFPTLLELAGLQPDRDLRARSLLDGLERGALPERPLVAVTTEHLYEPMRHGPWLRAMHHGPYSLVSRRPNGGSGPEELQLFDRRTDPGERQPIWVRDPSAGHGPDQGIGEAAAGQRAREFARLLERELEQDLTLRGRVLASATAAPRPSDPDLLREFGALGYMGGDDAR